MVGRQRLELGELSGMSWTDSWRDGQRHRHAKQMRTVAELTLLDHKPKLMVVDVRQGNGEGHLRQASAKSEMGSFKE